jgi:translocation and assembly module TamA
LAGLNQEFMVRSSFLFIYLPLLVLLTMMPHRLPAEELEFVIKGVGEPELSNVRNRVEPFQLTRSSRFSKRYLENLRHKSEQRAREALRPYGYYHATVNSEIRKSTNGGWVVELHITPGPPLVIRELNLELRGDGSKLEQLQEWQATWPLAVGTRLIQPQWEEQKQKALDIANNYGYLLAEFTQHELAVDLKRNEAALTLILETGEQAVMGEVSFLQDAVKPRVLENLPRFKTGDPYNAWLLERFRIDIWRTGYFSSIEIVEDRQLEESPPRVNLTVRMEPRKLNTYQGAIGVGSDTGPRLQFSWNRHLISKNGDNLSLATGWQEHNRELFVRGNYRIPRRVKAQQFWVVDLLIKKENEDLKVRENDFDENLIKLANGDINDYSLRLGRLKIRNRNHGSMQLFETMYTEYLRESVDFRVNPIDPPELVRLLALDAGEIPLARTDQYLMIGINYDLPDIRGNGFEMVGQRHRASAFTSNGAWGSDADFSQVYFSSRWNFIRGKRWKFHLRGEVGYSDARVEDILLEIEGRSIEISLTELPNLYRFKAGGSSSVRGYNFESLSSNGIGSNNIITASAEVEYMFRPNWSLAAFFDVGNAFNDWSNIDLKKGAGVGIRWYSIAGPIRVDIAQGIDHPDKPWRIHFTIGTSLL